MTIDDAIQQIQKLRPSDVDVVQIIAWLSKMDMRVFREVIEPRDGAEITEFTRYSGMTDRTRELLIPAPWDELYLYYLDAQLSYWLGEDEAYNIATARMQGMYEDFKADYASKHRQRERVQARYW